MNIELEGEAVWGLAHARALAVVAALILFLIHRLGTAPVEDFLQWLVVVLPALELTGLSYLAAMVADDDESAGGLSRVFAAFRWFGFVVLANWVLALFIKASLDAYVKLGVPAIYMSPV